MAAVAFDLIPETQDVFVDWQRALWLLIGALIFVVADRIVERKFGRSTKVVVRWASSSAPS